MTRGQTKSQGTSVIPRLSGSMTASHVLSSEFLLEAHERSVRGAQEIQAVLLQAHRGEKGERSVPGRTRRAGRPRRVRGGGAP
jgi:hypothetical protein